MTRIVILLPAPTTHSMFLYVDDVITELLEVCGGVTASINVPPVFHGEWMSGPLTRATADIFYIFSDAPFSLGDVDLPDWLEWLENLKLWCQEKFDWDIVWMTLHSVERITAHDYNRLYRR